MEDQLQLLFAKVLADLAKAYDLPELKTAKITRQSSGKPWYTATVEAEPRGQMAGMVRTLDVEATMVAERSTQGHMVELHYGYNHHQGGSNGYTTRFICILRREMGGDNDEYVATVPEHVVQTVARHCYDQVRLNCKGKTAEQIMEMYGDK